MVRTCRKFPNEWEKYDPVGRVIENTRLFAFKTPLRLTLQNKIHKCQQFTTLDLYRKVAESGQTLGLVINLNNTDRYYDRVDIEGMTIAYKDIPCPGRGFLNRNDFVKTFCKTIDEFLTENSENDYLIGIHCTNGVNRSGYLICRYLIERLGWSSHEALNAFEVARGYPIERGSFVQSLHKADREHRLKNQRIADDLVDGGSDEAKIDRKKKKKKRKDDSVTDEMSGIDPALTAQMMQQFFQMEQQFKEAAESAFSNPSYAPLSYERNNSSHTFNNPLINQNSQISNFSGMLNGEHHVQQKSFAQLVLESGYSQTVKTTDTTATKHNVGESEEIVINDRVIDYESMGKVDVRETSASELRRARRKRLVTQFQVMKRGRFWEINEMQKDMGL